MAETTRGQALWAGFVDTLSAFHEAGVISTRYLLSPRDPRVTTFVARHWQPADIAASGEHQELWHHWEGDPNAGRLPSSWTRGVMLSAPIDALVDGQVTHSRLPAVAYRIGDIAMVTTLPGTDWVRKWDTNFPSHTHQAGAEAEIRRLLRGEVDSDWFAGDALPLFNMSKAKPAVSGAIVRLGSGALQATLGHYERQSGHFSPLPKDQVVAPARPMGLEHASIRYPHIPIV